MCNAVRLVPRINRINLCEGQVISLPRQTSSLHLCFDVGFDGKRAQKGTTKMANLIGNFQKLIGNYFLNGAADWRYNKKVLQKAPFLPATKASEGKREPFKREGRISDVRQQTGFWTGSPVHQLQHHITFTTRELH